MLKSKRTNRIPVAPVTDEFIGAAFDGLASLSAIGIKCATDRVSLTGLRDQGYDLSGPVASGVVNFVHPTLMPVQWTGFNAFDNEPDITHFSAALTEYAVWIAYWEVMGYSIVAPVVSGTFQFRDRSGAVISGAALAHDLWIDDNDTDPGAIVNLIVAP